MLDTKLIATPDEVADLAATLAGSKRLAVDTEFHAERRFRPSLKLVQVATADGRSWVLDPLATELTALAPVFERSQLLVHGGQHDLALLQRATGTELLDVVDSQVLAGLAGSDYPSRLDALVHQWLGKQLPETRTLSDWTRRPLSPEQLAYAAADALVLFPLIDALEAAVADRGRADLAVLACAEMLRSPYQSAGPSASDWRLLDVAPLFDEPTRRVMAALFSWRLRIAEERNQPPHYLLGNGIALQLARSRPTTLDELSRDRRINSGLRKRFGVELLAIIAAALDPGAETPAAIPSELPARLAMLRAWSITQAPTSGIAARLALPDSQRHDVARRGPAALTPWRRQALGPALDALWDGRTALVLDLGRPGLISTDGAADVVPDGASS